MITHTYVGTYEHTYLRTHTYQHVHAITHTYTYASEHTYQPTCTHSNIYTTAHACIYTQVHTYHRMHTATLTPSSREPRGQVFSLPLYGHDSLGNLLEREPGSRPSWPKAAPGTGDALGPRRCWWWSRGTCSQHRPARTGGTVVMERV